jgi:hypothetical protein
MNGPDHYRAAEQLQQHARAVMEATEGPLAGLSPGERAQITAADLAAAQVHATLALAAAVGLSASLPQLDSAAWRDVAATRVAEAGISAPQG